MAVSPLPSFDNPRWNRLAEMTPSSAPPRIGKYEIREEIGHEVLVSVFRAVDRDIGRPVTLKVLTDVTNLGIRTRFRREVATIAKVRNDSVAAVYELGEHAGFPFA